MSFETLPLVHLDHGQLPEYPGQDAERVLTSLARRFGRVVVTDVSGVRTNDADIEFLQSASRRRAIWADAGSRYADDAMDLFVAGADAVTMRWNTLDRPEELFETAQLCQPGTLFLALEFPKGKLLQHGRASRTLADLVHEAEAKGVGIVYVLDTADEPLLRSLPGAATPRYVQGPFDPALVQSLGFQGVMLAPTRLPPEEAVS